MFGPLHQTCRTESTAGSVADFPGGFRWASVASSTPLSRTPLPNPLPNSSHVKSPVSDLPPDLPVDDLPPAPAPSGIAPVFIETELKRSYLDYAMSVIVSRALPDVRDGLKPVHRRILFGMNEAGNTHDKSYRKSAKTVGDVMGNYHPHGDNAIYDALVRMAQDFSMGLPLVDGQGNFGSVDGDPPAAMRYTESRLAKPANALLADIDEGTVDFTENYDGSRLEPLVLPARFPNLLVNGANGIAVGMATNIPPHNLGEVIDATLALLDNPALSEFDLLDIVPAPDFPTGGEIIGRSGSRSGLLTGRGSVILRAKTHFEEIRKDRNAIIVTEIPYQVNKATMQERIADLVREKRVEGISDIRDESDRRGYRVVIELKRDASPEIVLNQLHRFSQLQISFGVNMLALNGGRPLQMGLKAILEAFLVFREESVLRRTRKWLADARKRGHELAGLAIAVANIDEVIRIIREAPDPNSAREGLMSRDWPARDMAPLVALIADPRSKLDGEDRLRLSLEQARAILELRLQRLTGLGRDEIGAEAEKLSARIRDLLDILGSRPRVHAIMREDLLAVREAFAVPRRTKIVEAETELEDEDFIEKEDMVVTITRDGYVKRTPLAIYRTQKRGGKGRAAVAMKDEDYVTRLFVASTHAPVLFFSSAGTVYMLKVWRLPLGAPQSKGKAFVNLLPLDPNERITSVMALPEDEKGWAAFDLMFATRLGNVRRNSLADFVNVNRAGKIAMKPDEGDGIVDVQLCGRSDNILLTTASAACIRFAVDDVRVFKGRDSTGVRGINLAAGDEVIAMTVLNHVDVVPTEARAFLRHAAALRRAAGEGGADVAPEPESDAEPEMSEGESVGSESELASLSQERLASLGSQEQFVLTITSDGYGKRASAYEYRKTGRGGKGIVAHRLSAVGRVVASFPVAVADELLLVTDGGQMIRCPVAGVRIAGRATQGVMVIRPAPGEKVVGVERLVDLGGDSGSPDGDPLDNSRPENGQPENGAPEIGNSGPIAEG